MQAMTEINVHLLGAATVEMMGVRRKYGSLCLFVLLFASNVQRIPTHITRESFNIWFVDGFVVRGCGRMTDGQV